ncbi:MAG: two-component system alkaline phosphatase synthesis response regulator PhoP [Parasphingorhabdus sp.]|jgi:two-component system alkaline phosphatase synthesis response regulator PhoP
MKKILIVEDEEDLREIMLYNFKREGYEVLGVESGEDGIIKAKSIHPDIILLDLMLPKMSGLDVCRELKSDLNTKSIPIVMVSAKGEEADIVCGLELGADDYVTKPYSPRVLLARVRALLRRSKVEESVDNDLVINTMVLNKNKHSIKIDNEEIELTKSEFSILHFLVSNRGWVFTRFQIVNAIRGERYVVTERAIDVQIVGLRKKISTYGKMIETVRGIGYKFQE